jgi:hypothetical protein
MNLAALRAWPSPASVVIPPTPPAPFAAPFWMPATSEMWSSFTRRASQTEYQSLPQEEQLTERLRLRLTAARDVTSETMVVLSRQVTTRAQNFDSTSLASSMARRGSFHR